MSPNPTNQRQPEGKPLTRCPRCSSDLIHATARSTRGADAIVSRRCPECEHRDLVLASAPAVDAWDRREARVQRALAALSAAFADGLPLEIEEFFAGAMSKSADRRERT
jgi:DNA-directed RNA polymerase subunit RPC12/RpoP